TPANVSAVPLYVTLLTVAPVLPDIFMDTPTIRTLLVPVTVKGRVVTGGTGMIDTAPNAQVEPPPLTVSDIVTEAAPASVEPKPKTSVPVVVFPSFCAHLAVCPAPAVAVRFAVMARVSITICPGPLTTATVGLTPATPAAAANVPNGVVWFTFVNEAAPTTAPTFVPFTLLNETTTLLAPEGGFNK